MSARKAMRLDPRTKLALLFVWALAVFFSPGLPFEAGMMAVSYTHLSREACRMEHCLSEGSFEKLAALLGEGAAGRT